MALAGCGSSTELLNSRPSISESKYGLAKRLCAPVANLVISVVWAIFLLLSIYILLFNNLTDSWLICPKSKFFRIFIFPYIRPI
jgi:hypothetical protein